MAGRSKECHACQKYPGRCIVEVQQHVHKQAICKATCGVTVSLIMLLDDRCGAWVLQDGFDDTHHLLCGMVNHAASDPHVVQWWLHHIGMAHAEFEEDKVAEGVDEHGGCMPAECYE